MKQTIPDWAGKIYRTAKAHGWHDQERDHNTYADLFHAELSEATEEARNARPMLYGLDLEEGRYVEDLETIRTLRLKPEGAAVELIDCVIRILDYAMATWGPEGPHSDPEEWEDFAAAEERLRDHVLLLDTDSVRLDLPPVGEMDLEEVIAWAHCLVSAAWMAADEGGHLRAFALEDCASLLLAWLEAHGVDAEAVMALKHEYNQSRPYRHGGKAF